MNRQESPEETKIKVTLQCSSCDWQRSATAKTQEAVSSATDGLQMLFFTHNLKEHNDQATASIKQERI